MSAAGSVPITPPPGTPPNASKPPSLEELRKDEPRTAVEMWNRRVAKVPTEVAFRFHDGAAWKPMTYAEADTAAREIAAGLVAAGLAPGDRVCLLSQTRLEWALCDVGILLAGGCTVPIYASNTPEQCEFIVRDAGARLIIVEDDGQRDKVAALRGRLPALTGVVQIAAERPAAGAQTLADLRAAGRRALQADPALLASRGDPTPESLFTIVYTSGTTGTPKGVVLTHDNLVAAVCSGGRALQVGDGDEEYLFLPLAHILGREMVWAGVGLGYATTFSRGNAHIKDDLLAVRPTFMAGVPRIYEKFYAAVTAALKQGSPVKRRLAAWAVDAGMTHAAALRAGRRGGGPGHWLADKLVLSKLRARLGLDRCRFLISGGAPLSPEIAEFFHGAGLLILEGYGLTETTSAVFLNVPERYRFGTVGPAMDVIQTRIAEDGEILIKGPPVFRQYYNNPEATAESVEPDGWFHTGDIGVIEDGFLRITDRKKDLIVTAGGKKIAPQPLESALKAATPLIAQALVYGDKRPFCVALVTPSEAAVKQFGAEAAASPELAAAIQKALDAVNANLASFETIKRFAILPHEFTEASGELTPKMSVKRKVVVENHRAKIDALYSGPAPAAD